MSPRAACRLEGLGFTSVYDYVGGIADWKAAGLPIEGSGHREPLVRDAVLTDVPTLSPDHAVAGIGAEPTDAGWETAVVVDCDGIVIGRLRPPLPHDRGDLQVEQLMKSGPATVRADEPLSSLAARMDRRGVTDILVTTPQGHLIGILRRDETQRVLDGRARPREFRDCDGCPGRWASTV